MDDITKLTNEERAKLGYSSIPGQYNSATGLITADVLKSNETPIKVPETNNNVASDIINKSFIDEATLKREAEAKTSETDLSSALKSLYETEGKKGTYEEQAGIGLQKEKIADINKQIYGITQNFRAYEEGLRKDPNIVADVRNRRITEEQRRSATAISDLEFAKGLAEGSVERIEKAVKAKIDLETAPLKADLEMKKFIFENNMDRWTDVEKQKISRELKKEELAYQEKIDDKKKSQEMITNALTLQAPTKLITEAKNIMERGGNTVEIASALGKYSGDYLGNEIKKASLAKTNAEIKKLESEIKASNTVIDTSTLPNTTKGFATKLMASAKNEKDLDATERQQLTKMTSVIGQLDSLQSNLAKNNMTGVVRGRVNKLLGDLNLNKDITTINAQIQALIPNVARGIYGEVGVLTDADIENYKKTVANLKFSQDQNDAILALTLKNALRTYEGTLNTAVNSNINVSGWTQDYVKIQNKINEIEDRIGVSKEAVNNLISKNSALVDPIKEMYNQGFTDGEILEALNAR